MTSVRLKPTASKKARERFKRHPGAAFERKGVFEGKPAVLLSVGDWLGWFSLDDVEVVDEFHKGASS